MQKYTGTLDRQSECNASTLIMRRIAQELRQLGYKVKKEQEVKLERGKQSISETGSNHNINKIKTQRPH